MTLVLPKVLKDWVRRWLSGAARGTSPILASFTAGVVVTLVESACTGQVYFPLILSLVQGEGTVGRGVLLLLWYNFLFLVPLLVVLLLVMFGMSAERIAGLARRSVWGTKLALAVVFFALAYWLARQL